MLHVQKLLILQHCSYLGCPLGKIFTRSTKCELRIQIFCLPFLFFFYRFGHSLVSSLIQFYKDFKSSPDSFIEEPLDNHFFNVTMVLLKISYNVLPLYLPSERERGQSKTLLDVNIYRCYKIENWADYFMVWPDKKQEK